MAKMKQGFCMKFQNKCIFCEQSDNNICKYEEDNNKKYIFCEQFVGEFKDLLNKINDIDILLELEKQAREEKGNEIEIILNSYFSDRNRDSAFEYMLYHIRNKIFEIKNKKEL